jgi:transposase
MCGDATNGDIEVALVTGNDTHDGEMLPEIIDGIPEAVTIADVAGDGAYDHRRCYAAIGERGARSLIPPRKDAKIMRHGNSAGEAHPRDENLRRIRKIGRKHWKEECGYHKRSRAENSFFRLKTIFGDRISARTEENQRTELLLRVKLLNQFTLLGMPDSFAVL